MDIYDLRLSKAMWIWRKSAAPLVCLVLGRYARCAGFFRLLICLVLATLPLSPAFGRQDGLLQPHDTVHRFLERQHTLGHLPEAVLSHQPLSTYEAQRYLDSLATGTARLDPVDRALLTQYRAEGNGPGVSTFRRWLPFSFRNGYDFLSVRHDDYAFQINPLFYLTYGRARQTERAGREATLPFWQNTRGVRVSGHVGRYLFFETRLEENQRHTPWPVQHSKTSPRLGYTKFYPDTGVHDYWKAMGVVGLRSRYFEVRVGRDRNRWGFSQGSLLLSNYPTTYDQIQIRTTVWRLQYVSLFTTLSRPNPRASRFVPRTYGAFHRLVTRLPGRLQVGLFEAVMFASSDSLGLRDSGFDLTYLNPVIFYRAVEADRGSPDNALLGGEIDWVALPGLRIYSQLLIDELKVGEIGNDWWGNKWGWLAGIHLVDVPLRRLSIQAEYARLRPYLYSHRSPSTAFAHYNDVLGHPAGPNAVDVALIVDYQPVARWRGTFYTMYTRRGRNTETENYGSDPLASYLTRIDEYGITLLQGVRQTELLIEGHLGYELLPGVFLETAVVARAVDDAETGTDRYVAPFLMLRWGLPFQSLRY